MVAFPYPSSKLNNPFKDFFAVSGYWFVIMYDNNAIDTKLESFLEQ